MKSDLILKLKQKFISQGYLVKHLALRDSVMHWLEFLLRQYIQSGGLVEKFMTELLFNYQQSKLPWCIPMCILLKFTFKLTVIHLDINRRNIFCFVAVNK